ncbi:protocatechuate 3,4-dioxygenase subunit beta [uncultured Roseobacter sp.]|uniref:protocatechuate 3,4-dioxygenase subunit beta n=1 Tax=uncultured Roseobacter sp. TaxID=114847 RepID=UPI002625B370|nr:protocatechuate 3,4-dioxygenase subunit beta [uncultured Roseobacter sp.]
MTGSPGPLLPRDWTRQPPALTPDYRSTRLRAPQHARITLPSTPSEESGPVFGHDLLGPLDSDLTRNFAAAGQRAVGPQIIVHGQLRDQNGRGLPGALIEVWQANAGGRYRHRAEGYLAPLDPNFGGCGRVITDAHGRYRLRTVQPAPYPWPNDENAWRPAHIHFSVFGTSFAQRLITQMYFEGDPLIQRCPIVAAIPDPTAIAGLIAPLDMEASLPGDALAYRFDIVLRGRRASYFENRPEGM